MLTPSRAHALLVDLGAPPRLVRHVELVSEAAELLLAGLGRLAVPLDEGLVRAGVVLHDVGKTLHPAELDAPGSAHEPAGESLLLERGVAPALARICVSHARWDADGTSLEELVVALADKLWKGVRVSALEELVIDGAAARVGKQRWDVFVALDGLFEDVAAEGGERLERSRV